MKYDIIVGSRICDLSREKGPYAERIRFLLVLSIFMAYCWASALDSRQSDYP